MTREQVWETVSSFLRREFGRLLDVRDVRRVRRVAGDGWVVTVVLAAPSGDLHVADLSVDESGAMTPKLDGDYVVDSVRRAQAASASLAPPPPDELSDFGDANEEDDALGSGLDNLEMMEDPVEVRVETALKKGDPASLREARDLLPRLLIDPEKRGGTLLTMAEVEIKLAEPMLAKGYLEAAAREFGDRFDMPALEKAAALGLELVGKEAFVGSSIHALLEESRARLRPVPTIFDARSFQQLSPVMRAWIEPQITLRTLAPQEVLVSEGEPSQNVFVVKSGLFGVWLEKPSGGQWMVRCCFPGWLLGESSVLVPNDPRCTATLRAERVSEVWTVPAEIMKKAMNKEPEFADRIAQTKQLHRIDSFFSMHETMGQLDVQVRDEMLSCIQRLETFDEETILLPANEVPQVACLVARGEIALFEDGKPDAPIGVIGADAFYGVRDALHQIAGAVSAIARPHTTVAFFDAARLRALCERSPEHVVAVLERLG